MRCLWCSCVPCRCCAWWMVCRRAGGPVLGGMSWGRFSWLVEQEASNNMPLFEHDTQEVWRLLYLKAESIERQEKLQYLRQTWKSSIWSEEDDDSYTLPDPEIPLVYFLHYGQQCSPECNDG